MRDFLSELGIGASVFSQQQYPRFAPSDLQQQAELGHRDIMQQRELRCIHQNCPICAEKREQKKIEYENAEREALQKKKAYEKRCRKWVEKIKTYSEKKGKDE
jgi:hypothetical protein